MKRSIRKPQASAKATAAALPTYGNARKAFAGSPQCRADDFAEIKEIEVQLDRPGFQAGHVKQIADEAVQALRLILQCREQFIALARGVPVREAAQARHGSQDRGEWRPQIVRNRGQ